MLTKTSRGRTRRANLAVAVSVTSLHERACLLVGECACILFEHLQEQPVDAGERWLVE